MERRCLRWSALFFVTVLCMSSAAFAMEHDLNGFFRVRGDFTNFDQAGGNDASRDPANLSRQNEGKSFFYVEQRARFRYTGKFTDDVKLVYQVEIDSRWGDTSQVSSGYTRNVGGAMETDQVNLETKNLYMEFKVPSLPTTARVGTQPWDDSYKGIFLNADIAGVTTVSRMEPLIVNLGWLRGYDNKNFNGAADNVCIGGFPTAFGGCSIVSGAGTTGNGSIAANLGGPGRYSLDIGYLEGKYQVNKTTTVGGSYYLTYDNLNGEVHMLNTFGVNAATTVGPAQIDGFLLYQAGENPTNDFGQIGQNVSAFAANLAAKVNAGPGTLRATALYVSGDDGQGDVQAFQGVNQLGNGNATMTFSSAKMTMLITNTKYSANTDRAIINTPTNYNQGMIGGFVGYDMNIGKTFITGNIGGAATAKENKTFKPVNRRTGATNSSKYEGTEINAEVGYNISKNLIASVVGGYLFLGDYWKDTALVAGTNEIKTPDNPWKLMLVTNLAF